MRFLAVLFLAVPSFAQSVGFVLLLSDPPAAGAPLARARNVAAHGALKRQLAARQIAVKSEVHTLLNAIFVEADASRADELRALPGVQAVVRERRFYPKVDRAITLINAPAAWSLLGGVGNAGAGVRIGVVDTGIESTHPAFQDSTISAPSGFPVCSIANRPPPSNCGQYTSNKVIVARSYLPLFASNNAASSRPDDYTPRDRTGHGTAVASAAIAVAPKAWLGSYKVFGTGGVSTTSDGAIIGAVEDAFDDRMDIAVLSLGGVAFSDPLELCSGNNPCDPTATAVQNAVSLGMVVVVSAGNEGDIGSTVQPTLLTASSPGNAPNAIAVAALTNSRRFSNGLNVPGLGTFRALLGTGPAPPVGGLTARMSNAGSIGDPQVCAALPANSLTGTIAIVDRGTCPFADKVNFAQAAGAVGVIIVNNPGDNSLIQAGGLAGTGIPATMVGHDDGQSIRGYFLGNAAATATIQAGLQSFDIPTGNQVAGFSSRGPVLGSGALKPDVAAVGTDILLAGQTFDASGSLYSANGFLVTQGTSFSAPQIAGVAALVKQARPTLSALGIKSAVVNTATADALENGASASVLAVGAGRADAAAAVSTSVVAQPSGVSFGILRSNTLPLARQIQFTNLSSSPLNLTIGIERRTPEDTARISVDRPNIALPANGLATLQVTLTGTFPAPGNYEGFITVQGGVSALRIPFLYTVGTGVPFNILPIVGDGDNGIVGQGTSIGVIYLQVIDRYGIPVPNVPVQYSVTSGGGSIGLQSGPTDDYGLAGAQVILGSTPGANTFTATSGGLSTTFAATARRRPLISAGGVVDAASYRPGVAVAPGSYIAIYGTNLSPVTQSASGSRLPLVIGQVTVGFNAGNTPAPGYLHFATPGQVNAQVPWELAGQTSALVKVSVEDSSGNLYSLPLAAYAPGIFPIQAEGATFAAARDEDARTITPSNPAKQGRIIQLYCNGLGPVTDQPASGDPSPTFPLSFTTTTPIVTIGGVNAQVQFSGLTPTVVGLYQVNVIVPNTGPGVKPVVISIGGVTSKAENIAVQ